MSDDLQREADRLLAAVADDGETDMLLQEARDVLRKAHRAVARLTMKKLRASRRAQGLCIQCGTRPSDQSRCMICRARNTIKRLRESA